MNLSNTANIAALYADHHRWLQNWIGRHLRGRDGAADLAHNTFCRLLEHGCPDTPRSPRGFLATIARRLLIDDLRRRDLERAYVDCLAAQGVNADALTPERIAEATQLLCGIVEMLAALPAEVRRAFVLRRVDGLDHEQIARTLGISTRTVKRHVARAYVHFHDFAFAR